MGKAWAFSFATLGVSSLVAQVLLVRELQIVFYGNEFFIGWTLFSWLFWVALGALAGGRRRFGEGNPARPLVVCHVLVALLLPATLALVRASRTLLGGMSGAVPDLFPSMLYSLAVLAPLCIVSGAQFVWGARAWTGRVAGAEAGFVLGRAYALETAGFVAGGLLFSFWFAVANEFRVVGFLGCLNALAGFALCIGFRDRSLWPRLALIGAVAAISPVVVRSARLNRATIEWRYPGQVLVESRNSIYGNLAVTALDRQLNFHENGLLLGAEDERMASEQRVHFPMLWHPDPKQILLIGNGFNGALGEILKHRPDFVDYVELDAELVELAKKYIAPVRRAAMADPRVHTVFADGRFFLKASAHEPAAIYDVAIVNLPGPGTALINRFYSREFYRDVRKRLAPGGVLCVRLAFSPDYVGRELGDLGASIYRTLRSEFASVSILPEYEILYLASDAAEPPSAADLIARYEARALKTDFVVPASIGYRMGTDRIDQVRAAFEANAGAQINRDGRPIACLYSLAHWLRSFHPGAAAFASRLGALRWGWGAGAAALAALGMAAAARRGGPRSIGAWAMGFGSFTLMACEIVLLLAFQTFCGYLYYKLALILSALMLGMALGTVLGTRSLRRPSLRTLAGIHATMALFAVAFAFFVRWMGIHPVGTAEWIEGAFLLFAAAIGGLVGFEFPVANRAYLAGDSESGRKNGVIYGVDLAGSCLAALGIGLWALPVLGAEATLAILAGLNLAVALIARFPGSSRRPAPFRRRGGSGPRNSLAAR
ncbi:MAG: hypothetical protein AB7V14_07225 [Kiritimatiellia bacterium]